MSVTNEELQRLVENISLNYFHKPFLHLATFNKRLKTTGGRYHLSTHQLDFNPKILVVYDEAVLISIIKHELCHYHLHLEDKGFQHKDRAFKELLAKTGGSRFTPPLTKAKKKYQIECLDCHHTFYRQKRMNLERYRCRCGGKLAYR